MIASQDLVIIILPMTGTIIGSLISSPDTAITQLFFHYQTWVYWMMFVEYTIEAALIPVSTLPRDGLIFMMGSLSLHVPDVESASTMDLDTVITVLIIAGILGDSINYYLGKITGKAIVDKSFTILGRHFVPISSAQIQRTQDFITSYGYRSFTYGRILPIFRNFVPFVAGMTQTPFRTFIMYDAIGTVVLIIGLIGLGRCFGSMPWTSDHMGLMMRCFWGLILVGPFAVSWMKRRFRSSKKTSS